MEPAFIKFEVVSDDSPKIFRVEHREAARQRDAKAKLVQAGVLATAAASTVAVAGAVTLLPANPTLLRGDALRSKAARLCGQGEGGDTPNSNSTAPAGVQEEFEESVRELREQLEEKDEQLEKAEKEKEEERREKEEERRAKEDAIAEAQLAEINRSTGARALEIEREDMKREL